MQEMTMDEVEQVDGGMMPVAMWLAMEVTGGAAFGIVAVELTAIAYYYW